jgi:DNA repair protein RecO (recombination protein O)
MREITNVEGYVIKNVAYKDNDSIVTALGPQGLFTFRTHGTSKINSKNLAATGLLNYNKFSLTKSASGSASLSESSCLYPSPSSDSLDTMASLSFIAELTSKMLVDDSLAGAIYSWLDPIMKLMRNGFSPLTCVLQYLAHLLNAAGYGLNVDGCVVCGSKTDIVGISYLDGGFICDKEIGEDFHHCGPEKLKILRFIFRCKESDLARVSFSKEDCLSLLNELVVYLDDQTGIHLKSFAILTKC